jgi:hypothetical protein
MSLLEAPPRLDPSSMSRQEYLKASPPMFGPAWMDRLTRVHVAVVPSIFVPAILIFAVLALRDLPWWQVGLLLIAGYVVWTLTEYWLHRIVFHFEPDHPIGARMHWMIHGVHHDHPNDPLRLVMPPTASLPLAAIFAVAFQLLLPFAEACALSAGPRARSAASCASCTCATTSRTTTAGTASRPRGGTRSSGRRRASGATSGSATSAASRPLPPHHATVTTWTQDAHGLRRICR